MRVPKKFVPEPFGYHEEVELAIDALTNLGHGVGRINGWVVMVPFALPGERVRARIFRNHKNYSEGDLIEVLEASPERVEPRCPLFGQCGGCQYQHFSIAGQMEWKRRQVQELLEKALGYEVNVEPTHPSPQPYGYRSKLTPHYERPQGNDFPIGFLHRDRRFGLVDVPNCPIAVDAINNALPKVRENLRANGRKYRKGGTLLLRAADVGVEIDPSSVVTERVGDIVYQFQAGEFFQNNPFILPQLIATVIEHASAGTARYLVDAYCGVGVFSLAAAKRFERSMGIEISARAVQLAQANARLNRIQNCDFLIGKAESLFAEVDFPGAESAVVIDPPRAGCDVAFIEQLLTFAPQRIVYVSCDPATQARDLVHLTAGGYRIAHIQPFDLFPQTRHIENVVTLVRSGGSEE